MVKIIVAKTKHDCKDLIGTFLDENHYDILVDSDTDCYMPPDCSPADLETCDGVCEFCIKANENSKIAFKFRKNWFTKEEQTQAYLGLREAATESQNRGKAAGPRGDILNINGGPGRDWVTPYEDEILEFLTSDRNDLYKSDAIEGKDSIESIREKYKTIESSNEKEVRGRVWTRGNVTEHYPEYHGWFDRWVDGLSNKPDDLKKEEAEIVKGWISGTNYAKSVNSGIAGWFDRYPRIPYGRATSYTEKNPEKFALAYPFLQSLNRGFKELIPGRWKAQKEAADSIDSRYLVPGTVFTTITVNKTFRTAAHYDAGDLNAGLSNLLVVGTGNYTGGYLIFPEYRVAVNVRPGDLLLVNNHEVMHGNTPIVLDNPNDPTCERISLVCYFRENMVALKSMEYENLRKKYIDERRLNKSHESWKPLWNGISPGCFKSEEWRDFLRRHNQVDEDGIVDVFGEKEKKATLSDFFS